ncbi:MAG: hypothetical protein H6642_15535 [Caldilineaceae bacterium]|nr:hypothetical protein [Caldilineaceae bacterium]
MKVIFILATIMSIVAGTFIQHQYVRGKVSGCFIQILYVFMIMIGVFLGSSLFVSKVTDAWGYSTLAAIACGFGALYGMRKAQRIAAEGLAKYEVLQKQKHTENES